MARTRPNEPFKFSEGYWRTRAVHRSQPEFVRQQEQLKALNQAGLTRFAGAHQAPARHSAFDEGVLQSIRNEGKSVPHQQREDSEFGGPLTGADVELERRRKQAALRELDLEETQRQLAEQVTGEERRGVAPPPETARALEREKTRAGVGLTRAQAEDLPARTGLEKERLALSQREASTGRAHALRFLEARQKGEKEIAGIQAGRRSPQAIVQGLAALLQRQGVDPATAADMVRNFANEYLDVAAPRGLLSDLEGGDVSLTGGTEAASSADIDEAREVIAEAKGKRPDQVTDAEIAEYLGAR